MIAWRLTEIDDLSWRLGAWIFAVLIPKYSGLLSGITWGQVLISRSSVNILSISCDVVPSNVCVYRLRTRPNYGFSLRYVRTLIYSNPY
jgi:hypothetical protein